MGLRKRGIAGTSEAISTIHNSWKSPECDESSSLQRFIGDFGHEDHLFIDLRINHCVQSLDPRLVLRGELGLELISGPAQVKGQGSLRQP